MAPSHRPLQHRSIYFQAMVIVQQLTPYGRRQSRTSTTNLLLSLAGHSKHIGSSTYTTTPTRPAHSKPLIEQPLKLIPLASKLRSPPIDTLSKPIRDWIDNFEAFFTHRSCRLEDIDTTSCEGRSR